MLFHSPLLMLNLLKYLAKFKLLNVDSPGGATALEKKDLRAVLKVLLFCDFFLLKKSGLIESSHIPLFIQDLFIFFKTATLYFILVFNLSLKCSLSFSLPLKMLFFFSRSLWSSKEEW